MDDSFENKIVLLQHFHFHTSVLSSAFRRSITDLIKYCFTQTHECRLKLDATGSHFSIVMVIFTV
jgi:hypothetical protein